MLTPVMIIENDNVEESPDVKSGTPNKTPNKINNEIDSN